MSQLTDEGLRLLLRLLEAKTLRFSHSSLVDYHQETGAELIRSHFMVADGHRLAATADDDDGEPVSVVFDDRRGEHGYNSPIQGWTRVDKTEMTMYRPDISATARQILGDNLIVPRSALMTLVPELAWEIGQVRLLSNLMTTVWFARRLHDGASQRALMQAAQVRPAAHRNLLLTTTTRVPSELSLPNTTIVSVSDVLSSHQHGSIDFAILKARFVSKEAPPNSGPLHLSDDGSVLTIHSDVIVFRGDVQQAAIRRLVDAYKRDERVNAASLLESVGSGTLQFSQAFRSQWPKLKPYLRSANGTWSFEL